MKHNPRCAYLRDPPSLRDPSDCNCGAIPPLQKDVPRAAPPRWRLDQIVTVKTVQRSLPKLLRRAEPLVVTRRGQPVAVLVPIDEYEGKTA